MRCVRGTIYHAEKEREGRKVQGEVSRVQENVVRNGDFTGGIY